MNPLMIARGIGKQVDLLLRNGDPPANSDILANACSQIVKGLKNFHMWTLAASNV